jgi:hypothetical protein
MCDGYIMFQGHARESVSHFAKMVLVCPIHSNPSDYFMKVLSINYPKTEDDERYISRMNDHY